MDESFEKKLKLLMVLSVLLVLVCILLMYVSSHHRLLAHQAYLENVTITERFSILNKADTYLVELEQEYLKKSFIQSYSKVIEDRQDNKFFYDTMSEKDINNLLTAIWDNSVKYEISPYKPLAYIWSESRFDVNAVSVSGARGLYQFMPTTAEHVLKDSYYDGCEHDIAMSTEAWFLYYTELRDLFSHIDSEDEVELWIANSYVGGPSGAREASFNGVSALQYDKSWVDFHAGYARDVSERIEFLASF